MTRFMSMPGLILAAGALDHAPKGASGRVLFCVPLGGGLWRGACVRRSVRHQGAPQ
jgi:hypothetical protein